MRVTWLRGFRGSFLQLITIGMLLGIQAGNANAQWPVREGFDQAASIYQELQALPYAGTGAPSGDVRTTVLLNNEWNYRNVSPDGSLGSWLTALVPNVWNSSSGNHVRWYGHNFYFSTYWAGKQVRLRFDAVSLYAAVYWNGQYIGEHAGQYTPFEIDVTDYVIPGQANTLTVYNKDQTYAIDGDKHYHQIGVSSLNLPPSNPANRNGRGGIWQDVSLIMNDVVSADEMHVQTSFRQGSVALSYLLKNWSDSTQTVTVSNVVTEWDAPGVTALTIPEAQYTIPANDTVMVTQSMAWLPEKLWSPENPDLYVLKTGVELADGSDSDLLETRFGFREFWIDGPDFRLNGIKIRLRGESQLSNHSYAQQLQRREVLELLMRAHKEEFGSNAVRVHAAIGVPEIFSVADEVGLLVINQSSIWSRGNSFYTRGVDKFLPNTEREFKEWIIRDRNHPSVVIWSAENEMIRGKHDAMSWVMQLDDFIRPFDQTRPIEHDGAAFGGGNMEIYHVHHQENYTNVMNAWKNRFDKPMIMGEWWVGGNSGERRLTTGQDVRDYDDWVGKSLPLWLDHMEEQRIQGVAGIMPFQWSNRQDPGVFEEFLEKIPSLTWNNKSAPGPKPSWGLTWLNPGWAEGEPEYQVNPQKAVPFARGLGPYFAGLVERSHTAVGNTAYQRTVAVCNDSENDQALQLQWSLLHNGATIVGQSQSVTVAAGEQERVTISPQIPPVTHTQQLELRVELSTETGEEILSQRNYPVTVYPDSLTMPPALERRIGVYDPQGATVNVLQNAGIPMTILSSLSVPDSIDILIVGERALQVDQSAAKTVLPTYVDNGGRVLILQQDVPVDVLPVEFGFAETSVVNDFPAYVGFDFGGKDKIINYSDYVPVLAPEHPVFHEVPDSLLSFWNHDDNRLADDIHVKPTAANNAVSNNVRVLAGGARREYASILECPYGSGTYLATQLHLMDNYGIDPEATVLFHNMLKYLDGQQGRIAPKNALVMGQATGTMLQQTLGARAPVVQTLTTIPDTVQSIVIGSEVADNALDWNVLNNFLWDGGVVFCFPRSVPPPVTGRVQVIGTDSDENFLSLVNPGKVLSGFNSFDSEGWTGDIAENIIIVQDTTGLVGELTAGALEVLTGQSKGYIWKEMTHAGAAAVEYRIGEGRLVLSQLASPTSSNPQAQFIYAAMLTNLGVALNVDFPTDIDELNGQSTLPIDYALLPNVPNPFNPVTTLRYQLPKTTNLRLAIYNVLGQRVRVLVDETQDAGHYAVQWDGRNQNGGQVSSGVYLYHLECRERALTGKMLLLR
jgi:hypothetical protein